MINKTELTKKKIYGSVASGYDGEIYPLVIFGTSSNIKKINKLFSPVLWCECFQGDSVEASIQCKFSDDFKELLSMKYIIDSFKYDYHKEIPCEEIFNEEELKLIREESHRLINEATILSGKNIKIKREQWVIVRNNKILCKIGNLIGFKQIDNVGNNTIKTYLSKNKAETYFIKNWENGKELLENEKVKIVKVVESLISVDK